MRQVAPTRVRSLVWPAVREQFVPRRGCEQLPVLRTTRGAPERMLAVRDRVLPIHLDVPLRRVQLALEAVPERLETKLTVLRELEGRLPPAACLGTSTSLLSVDALAAGLKHPERLVGWHAAIPAGRSGLIEIIRGSRTSEEAVTDARRSPLYPSLPTVAEAGNLPGYAMNTWWGLLAPKGVPEEVVRRVRAAVVEALAQAEVQARLRELGITPVGGTPEEFAATIRDDVARYARIVRSAGLAPQ